MYLCPSVKRNKMKVKLKVKQVNKKTQNSSMHTMLPIEGELSEGLRGSSFNWGKLLKILIAILTALAGSLGLASCAA